MPAKNVEQIKIWKPAHEWLMSVSNAYKARGQSSASMTALASQAILSIPMPNGNGNTGAEDPNRHYSIDDYIGHESEIPTKDLLTSRDAKVKP